MPILPVPDGTECSYNGFTFPVETWTKGLDIATEMGSGNRVHISNRYTLKIESLVIATSGGQPVDSQMESIRTSLTAAGGQFKYAGKGAGNNLNLNYPGGAKDLAWGPIPKLLSLRPEAGNRAWWINWQVEFQTLDCSGFISQFDLMEFAYSVEFTHDRRRMTHRNYKGHIRIPNNRTSPGSPRLNDSVDFYFDNIVPPCPLEFERQNETRTIADDKSRLDFSFTDVQLLVPPPFGCTKWSATHKTANAKPSAFSGLWTGQLRAHYEVAPHFRVSVAHGHFRALVADRVNAMLDNVAVDPKLGRKTFIPLFFEMEEDLAERVMNYSFTYSVAWKLPAVMASGFWRPAPGHDYQTWATSMELAYAPRGYTQEVIRETADVLINLCRSDEAADFRPGQAIPFLPGDGVDEPLVVVCPDPENSWIYYEIAITVSTDEGVAIGKPLPQRPMPPPRPSLVDQFTNPNGFAPVPPGADGQEAKNPPVIPQKRTSTTVYVWLTGRIIRACYPIPEPTLVSLGGAMAIPCNRDGIEYFAWGITGNCGVPVYVAKFKRRYVLTQSPARPGQVGTNANGGQPANAPEAPTTPDIDFGGLAGTEGWGQGTGENDPLPQ